MKIKNIKFATVVLVLLFLIGVPGGIVSASNSNAGGTVTTFEGLLGRLSSLINSVVPFIVGLAVFVIMWGIFTYVTKAGDEEKRTQARQFIVWGVIGVFFMLSIWGLVNILLNSINLDRTIKESDIPKVPSIGGGGTNYGTGGNKNGGTNEGTNGDLLFGE